MLANEAVVAARTAFGVQSTVGMELACAAANLPTVDTYGVSSSLHVTAGFSRCTHTDKNTSSAFVQWGTTGCDVPAQAFVFPAYGIAMELCEPVSVPELAEGWLWTDWLWAGCQVCLLFNAGFAHGTSKPAGGAYAHGRRSVALVNAKMTSDAQVKATAIDRNALLRKESK